MPFNILPPGISLQEYEINFNKASQAIEKVTHKQDGDVQFLAQLIDQDIGFVMQSVVEVYT